MKRSPAFTGQTVIMSTLDLQNAIASAIQSTCAVYSSKGQSVGKIE